MVHGKYKKKNGNEKAKSMFVKPQKIPTIIHTNGFWRKKTIEIKMTYRNSSEWCGFLFLLAVVLLIAGESYYHWRSFYKCLAKMEFHGSKDIIWFDFSIVLVAPSAKIANFPIRQQDKLNSHVLSRYRVIN